MTTTRFTVMGDATPQLLMRALNLFAQRDLAPAHVSARIVDSTYAITIDQPGLSEQQARIIASKMGELTCASDVSVGWGRIDAFA